MIFRFLKISGLISKGTGAGAVELESFKASKEKLILLRKEVFAFLYFVTD